MSSNNSTNSGGGGEDKTELIVSICALVISIIAFVATGAQALQQYYASATGYSNCTRKVMGDWATSTRRRFRWYQVKFEVEFEAPVIFLAPPTNNRKPLPDKVLYYMNGSDESYMDVRIDRDEEARGLHPQNAQKKAFLKAQTASAGSRRRRVDPGHAVETLRTADMADNGAGFKGMPEKTEKQLRRVGVHTADNERATWLTLLSALQRMERDSSDWQDGQYPSTLLALPRDARPLWGARSLSVAVQPKLRSYDTMPSNVKKPYATTTFCHLVEMAACLGMYWREFDQTNDRYRADGNGYILFGGMVSDLGLMFSFHKIGDTSFTENRLIPANAVKELCFGYVPTIFRKEEFFRDELKPKKPPMGLMYPIDAEKKTNEIHTLQLGSEREISETLVMLGCNARTSAYLSDERKNQVHLFPVVFELIGMLACPFHIKETSFRMLPNPTVMRWNTHAFNLPLFLTGFLDLFNNTQFNDSEYTKTIKNIMTEIPSLSAESDEFTRYTGEPGDSWPYHLLDDLHATIDRLDEQLTKQREYVVQVVRRHLQAVIAYLNARPDPSPAPGANTNHLSFVVRLNETSPEQKEMELMRFYFSTIRDMVRGGDALRGPRLSPVEGSRRFSTQLARAQSIPLNAEVAEGIWYALVFRMICWLMLHDFHKKDVQVPKSELLGSRLPVYIS